MAGGAGLPWQPVGWQHQPPCPAAAYPDGRPVRSAALRFLRLDQIDGDVWTKPGEPMKGRSDAAPDLRVPLWPKAQEIN